MEKGDIVVCVDDHEVQMYVTEGKYYTVRGFLPHGSLFYDGSPWRSDDDSGGIFLQEVYVDIHGYDHPLRTSRFRKVDTMDLAELLEEKEVEYV